MAEPTPKFETERISEHRKKELSELNKNKISNIESFGCSVLHVTGNPAFSYTVGIFDTCGKPEVIAVGLYTETAHFLLNDAASKLRQGVDLTQGRHKEMVGEVECEFRPVDVKWVRHLMNGATWFYGPTEFPVLQAVYPDRENRFPEDPDFDQVFRQPMLQPDAPFNVTESDFWASNDPNSTLFNWRFSDPPHTRVFLSETIHSGAEPVTYVSHDAEDEAWQFLGDSMSGGNLPLVSCFHHLIDQDATLNELADLPLGWWAERTHPGAPWVRHQHDEDDERTSD